MVKINVLVVDDSEIITQRITEMLYEVPCVNKVEVVQTFNEAVTYLLTNAPYFALLDIELQQKSGIELLGFIKKNYPLVKVIMVSNKASIYYRNICHALGADSFIDKSKEFENIPTMITNNCMAL